MPSSKTSSEGEFEPAGLRDSVDWDGAVEMVMVNGWLRATLSMVDSCQNSLQKSTDLRCNPRTADDGDSRRTNIESTIRNREPETGPNTDRAFKSDGAPEEHDQMLAFDQPKTEPRMFPGC